MTIDEMIEALEGARLMMGGDTQVMLAMQRSHPMQFDVAGIATTEDVVGDEGEALSTESGESAAWIVAASGPSTEGPYAERALWDVAGAF